MVNGANIYENTNQPVKGNELYERAASLGFAMAQYNLGNNYVSGQGVKQNYAKAAYWFEKAAQQGYREAQSNYATLLSNGLGGIEINLKEAEKWYLCAADQGDSLAMVSLGKNFIRMGGQMNLKKAVDWLDKAALLGQPEAITLSKALAKIPRST
jgi:uncharacterized protein